MNIVNILSMMETNKLIKPKSSKTIIYYFVDDKTYMCQYYVMFIIIDGYNLIRQSNYLKRYELKSLQTGRNALLSRLSDYQKKRWHEITVVFDGWQGEEREEERDRYENIDIIFSGYGEYADDVIKRIAAHSEGETIVVSSDREITSFASGLGKTTLSSVEFEKIINKTINSLAGRRYHEVVMEKKNKRKKKGPSHKSSKAQRSMQKIMNRL